MQPTDAPKPGPHLSPSTTSYRELAKHHAARARDLLEFSEATTDPAAAALIAGVAQAYALTSLAFTQLAPPSRYRPRCTHRPPVSVQMNGGEQA